MRWRMLAVLAAARMGLGLQFQTLGSTGEYLIADFGLDYTQIGALIGIFMTPGLFLALPAGFVGRFVSDRLLSATGLALLALGGLVAAMAEGYGAIALGRAICGAGFVICTLYMTKMVSDWFSGREIATALSILVMTWPLSIAVGQILHEWLAATQHWSAAFGVSSAYSAVAAIGVLILYRTPEADGPNLGAAPLRPGLSRNEFILIAVASCVWSLFNAAYIVYLSFAPKALTAAGAAPLEAAAVISLTSWFAMFSGALAGQAADRTGRPDLVLYICLTIGTAALLLVASPGWALIASLTLGLIGLAPAGVIMALTGAAMRPENRAFGMGLFFTGYFLVVAPAPVVGGRILDQSGDAFFVMVFAAGLLVSAIIINVVFRILKPRLPY